MKEAYLFALVVATIIIAAVAAYTFVVSYNKRDKLSITITVLYLSCIVTCVSYIFAVGVTDVNKAYMWYGLYFTMIDWMLIVLLVFIRMYTRLSGVSLGIVGVMSVLGLVDTFQMVLNNRFHKTFALKYEVFNDLGEEKFTVIPKGPYFAHLIFSYAMVLTVVILLLIKIKQTAGARRRKYYIILGLFVLVVLSNGIFMLFRQPLDMSQFTYVAMVIALSYFAIFYTRHGFIEEMLSQVTSDVDCALFCFDENDVCVYANGIAERVFETSKKEHKIDVWFESYKGKRKAKDIEDALWSDSFCVDGQELLFDIQFKKSYDNKGFYSGCYFMMYDKSKEAQARELELYRRSHDFLTGALVRESFYEEARKILDTHIDKDYVIVCSNVKDFKLINDIFGAEIGDKILTQSADAIRARIHEGSCFARMEADRFAILMPKDKYDEKEFLDGIERVANIVDTTLYRMQIHIGVYEVVDRRIPISLMCDRAYLAIASIKESYKEKIAYYGDTLRQSYTDEQKVLGEFEGAIKREEFVLYLQPQIDTEGKLRGAEALVRWQHPERGLVSPAYFINILEHSGFIYKLDMYVWEHACRQLAEWKEKGRDDLYISVNISVKDFFFIDVARTIVDLTKKYNVDPKNLNLEITETAFMQDYNKQIELTRKLQDAGFKVEIDDFGSGYSSLNMLKDMTVDILKIDMAFLAVTENEARSQKIVNMVISLAKALNMVIITEGVETQQQVDYLKEAGCDIFQGYYFEKPIPIPQFENKYHIFI